MKYKQVRLCFEEGTRGAGGLTSVIRRIQIREIQGRSIGKLVLVISIFNCSVLGKKNSHKKIALKCSSIIAFNFALNVALFQERFEAI